MESVQKRAARVPPVSWVKSRGTLLITRSCRYRCGYRRGNRAARPPVKMASCTLTSNKWRDVSVRLYLDRDWQGGRYRYATTNYLSPRLWRLINAEIHYRHLAPLAAYRLNFNISPIPGASIIRGCGRASDTPSVTLIVYEWYSAGCYCAYCGRDDPLFAERHKSENNLS